MAEIKQNIFRDKGHPSVFLLRQESLGALNDVPCSSIVKHFDCPPFLGDYEIHSAATTGFSMLRLDEKVGKDIGKATVQFRS